MSETPVLAGKGAGLPSVSMAEARVGTAFVGSLLVSDIHTDDVVGTGVRRYARARNERTGVGHRRTWRR